VELLGGKMMKILKQIITWVSIVAVVGACIALTVILTKKQPVNAGNEVYNGVDGQNGITPHIDNGNWFLGDTDTGISALGQNGIDGSSFYYCNMFDLLPSAYSTVGISFNRVSVGCSVGDYLFSLYDGNYFIIMRITSIESNNYYHAYVESIKHIKGEDGVDGTTSHIDETSGNWFLGDTDTGVSATGQSGTGSPNITPTYLSNPQASVEYNTGKKWVDGSAIYRQYFVGEITSDMALTGEISLVNDFGLIYEINGYWALTENYALSFLMSQYSILQIDGWPEIGFELTVDNILFVPSPPATSYTLRTLKLKYQSSEELGDMPLYYSFYVEYTKIGGA
jgi:hypothetical protein